MSDQIAKTDDDAPGPGLSPSIRQFLARAQELKVFPQAAAQIQQVAEDPSSSLTDLERAVALDPTLSAQVLRVANSPLYGLNRQVGTLRQALVTLGFEGARTMALALSLIAAGGAVKDYRRQLWQHAVATASIAHALAQGDDALDASQVFLAAVLHDLGKLLLDTVNDGYENALALTQLTPTARIDAEQSVFGFDHAQLGAACLEQWNLPAVICWAVSAHHRPTDGASAKTPDQRAVAIVRLANALQHAASASSMWQELERLECTDAAHALGLDQNACAHKLAQASRQPALLPSM